MTKLYFLRLLVLVTVFATFLPTFVQAQAASTCVTGSDGYCMLAPLPGIANQAGKADIGSYIPGLVKLIIGLATVLAILVIIRGGFQYLLSATTGGKSEGRQTIQNALIGLLLVIGAYTILYTVNPKLVRFTLTIPGLKVGDALNTDLGTGGSGLNPDGTIATGCSQCVRAKDYSFPQKTPACAVDLSRSGCALDPVLAKNLDQLYSYLSKKMPTLKWQVTEMFPPTVDHADPCHSNGTCVDAALINKNPSATDVGLFMASIQGSVSPSFLQYEVPCPKQGDGTSCTDPASLARLKEIKDVLAGTGLYAVINIGATGEHAHIRQ